MADDDREVAGISAQVPAAESATHLNSGTSGPLPRVAIEATDGDTEQDVDRLMGAVRVG